MKFSDKLRQSLMRFMSGRAGIDQLGIALFYAVILLNILSLIPFLRILSSVAFVVFVVALYRMLSRNTQQRYKENQWWLTKSAPLTTKLRQALVRFRNRKQYRYFRCPQCRAMLKLPRNVGEVTVTCGSCKHSFKKKA